MLCAPASRRVLPFSLAHTDALGCRHIPHASYECPMQSILAPRNTPWRIVSAEGCYPRVALCHALCPVRLSLITRGDESAMIFERLGVFFRTFLQVGSDFVENVFRPVSGGLRSRFWPSRGRCRHSRVSYLPQRRICCSSSSRAFLARDADPPS